MAKLYNILQCPSGKMENKNMPIIFAVLGLLTLALFFGPQKVLAEEIIFADDFNDGNYNGWTVESGNWLIDSHKELMGIKTGKLLLGKINTGESSWDNYQIELDAKNNWGIDESIGFRRSDNNNYYEVVLRYALNGIIGYQDAPEVILQKKESGVTTKLFSTHNVILITGNQQPKPYHIKISAAKEHLQLWIDNALVFDLTDSGTKVKSGSIFLSYWTGENGSAVAVFDNIKITSLSKVFYPVIFVPGIGGSELQLSQDFIWSKEDGHEGIYSHAYTSGEKVWVNEGEAAKPGEDDYFDILRLKADGQTSEAPLGLTGNLTPFGYSDIDSFFSELGYSKGTNFFVFNYDWRKDIKLSESSLDSLIEEAKAKSGMPKVNIVAHSMGGLVARNYIISQEKAAKVNKLIELGVPHLGAVDGLKAIIYGKPLGRQIIGDLYLGVSASETKDVLQNFPAAFQLLPSEKFYQFYNNSTENLPYPFYDERDIDNNQETGVLNFHKIKTLLNNLSYNIVVFNLAKDFHDLIDPTLNQLNGVNVYQIVGSGQPTLGQIRETWRVSWPVKLIDHYEEIYINGDNTVPLYSASLKSPVLDFSGGANIYYVEQSHSDLVTKNKPAMQTVKAILNEGDPLPVEVKNEKINLEGQQISVDNNAGIDIYDENNNHTGLKTNGEIEENIPGTFYSSVKNSKNIFIKKSASNVKVKVTPKKSGKINIKTRAYKDDKVSQTAIYRNLEVVESTKIESTFTPTAVSLALNINDQTASPSSIVSGTPVLDQTPPKTTATISGNNTQSATITLAAADSESGILQTEYSLDNGQTVQVYSGPFTISTPGTTTLQVTSIDKLGNEEKPQIFTVNIISPTPTPTSSPSSTSTTSNNTESENLLNDPQTNSSSPVFNLPQVLGLSTKKAEEIIQEKIEAPLNVEKAAEKSSTQSMAWLLLIPAFAAANLPLVIILPHLNILRFWLHKPTPK